MPPRKTQFAPGQFYHVYNRGAGGQTILRDDDNYLFLLRRVKEHAIGLEIGVIAYCLLPNHYYLLLRQDGSESAGRLPQRVFNSYTNAFNKRYERTGTLFEGPYKAVHVDREGYLLHLCRYIHANPVKHGLVSDLAQWPYSNYHEWIGARAGTLLDRAFVQAHFPAAGSYCRFVLDYFSDASVPPAGFEDYVIED